MYKPKPPNSVTVIVITTVTIIFWVFFSVYRVLTSQPEPDVPPEILAPLNPNLNQDALQRIENGIYFDEEELLSFPEGSIEITTLVEEQEEEIIVEEEDLQEDEEIEASDSVVDLSTTVTPTPTDNLTQDETTP